MDRQLDTHPFVHLDHLVHMVSEVEIIRRPTMTPSEPQVTCTNGTGQWVGTGISIADFSGPFHHVYRNPEPNSKDPISARKRLAEKFNLPRNRVKSDSRTTKPLPTVRNSDYYWVFGYRIKACRNTIWTAMLTPIQMPSWTPSFLHDLSTFSQEYKRLLVVNASFATYVEYIPSLSLKSPTDIQIIS